MFYISFFVFVFDFQLLFFNTIMQKVINGVGWRNDHHGLLPIVCDTVTLVFTLISYFAIVFSFFLISTDNWFSYYAIALSIVCLLSESYE